MKGLTEKERRKALLVPPISAFEALEGDRQARRRRTGRVDILVTTPHQATVKDIGDISDEKWQTTLEVNIYAMFTSRRLPFRT